MTRRKRCTRCGGLYPPGELSQPSRGERLCETCLLDVANEQAAEAEHDRLAAAAKDEHVRLLEAGEHPPRDDAADAREMERVRRQRERLALPDVTVPGWPCRRGRVSASSLAAFARCPEQFRRRYVLGERTPPGAAMLAGSAVHGALQDLMQARIDGEEDIDVAEAYHARFGEEVDEAGGGGVVQWGDTEPDDWRARGEAVAVTYQRRIAPRVEPVSVERLFTVTVPGVPLPVIGYIDLTTPDSKIDYKFGKRVHPTIGPDWLTQAYVYLLADDLPMAYHSLSWPGRDGSVSYRTPSDSTGLYMEKTPERYAIATNIVRSRVAGILAMAARFGTDEPWPDALTHPWACHVCDFRLDESCPYWHPRVVTL